MSLNPIFCGRGNVTLSSLVRVAHRISLIAEVLLCGFSSCFDGSFFFFSIAQQSGGWRCAVGVKPSAGGYRADPVRPPLSGSVCVGAGAVMTALQATLGTIAGANDWWDHQVQRSICHCRTHDEGTEERWMAHVGLRWSAYVKWMDERAEALLSALTPWRGPFPRVCSGVCRVNWPQSKTTPKSSCSNLCLLFTARRVVLDTGSHVHFIFISVWRSTAWSAEFT